MQMKIKAPRWWALLCGYILIIILLLIFQVVALVYLTDSVHHRSRYFAYYVLKEESGKMLEGYHLSLVCCIAFNVANALFLLIPAIICTRKNAQGGREVRPAARYQDSGGGGGNYNSQNDDGPPPQYNENRDSQKSSKGSSSRKSKGRKRSSSKRL